MKKIKWLIEDRELPSVGMMATGKEYLIDEIMADQLIAQGHAEPVKADARAAEKKET